tara:strand:+ start:99 stop:296 length:198 start_codon:yes stop_codon:yes gene_type:complete
MNRVTTATVALTYEQREQVARDFLIDLLEDIAYVPFGDPTMVDAVNRIIAFCSPPDTWEDGKYDR